MGDGRKKILVIDDSSVIVEVPVTKACEDMGLNKAE